MYAPGQKLECIYAGPWLTIVNCQPLEVVGPKLHEIVTFRDRDASPNPEQYGFLLNEYRTDTSYPSCGEIGYYHARFRPVIEVKQETSIEIFQSLLKTTKVPEPV